MAECGTAAAGVIRCCIGTIFVARAEGIVKVVEETAAGEHEIPGLAEVGGVLMAEKPSFVITKGRAQTIVEGQRLGIGIVKI
jgi:hypothetical protein